MKKEVVTLNEKLLVGITVRTNNTTEANLSTAKIGNLISYYYENGLNNNVTEAINKNVTYAAYYDYESDFTGDYTYFIGTEVSSFEGIPEGMISLTIPTQNYCKFTSNYGSIPQIVIETWQEIWQTNFSEFNTERSYKVDFEIYDERAYNLEQACLDIFIGIN